MFKIKKSVRNKPYFVLYAGNNKVILTSEEYESMQGLKNGIKSVRVNSPLDDAYERFTGDDGKYYFNLRARNNKVIGVSQGYSYKITRFFGIRSVKKNGPSEKILYDNEI